MSRHGRIGLCAAWFAAAVLIGCRFDISAVLGLKAASACAAGTVKTAMLDATLQFEISGEDDFKEKKDQYAAIMGKYFTDVKNIRFQRADFNNYFVCDAKVLLVRGGEKAPGEGLHIVYFTVTPTSGGFNLGLHIDGAGLADLNNTVQTKYYQSVKIDDIRVSLKVMNDLDGPVALKAYSLYLDGKPVPLSGESTLDGGREASLRISDIFRDSVYTDGDRVFLEVTRKTTAPVK